MPMYPNRPLCFTCNIEADIFCYVCVRFICEGHKCEHEEYFSKNQVDSKKVHYQYLESQRSGAPTPSEKKMWRKKIEEFVLESEYVI